MKTEKLARVRYDQKEDSFVLEVWQSDCNEWGFDCSVRCVQSKNGGEGPDFIHFSFLKSVIRLAELGYSIHFAKEG